MTNAIIEIEEWFCCEAKAPKKMYFKTTGAGYISSCSKCSYVCAYWDCACELRHDCNETVTNY